MKPLKPLKPRYTCVNEDGVVYDTFDNVEEALAMLHEFPNDSVVITLER